MPGRMWATLTSLSRSDVPKLAVVGVLVVFNGAGTFLIAFQGSSCTLCKVLEVGCDSCAGFNPAPNRGAVLKEGFGACRRGSWDRSVPAGPGRRVVRVAVVEKKAKG
jgi:hypothetical protein